jgi:hypothetical protein
VLGQPRHVASDPGDEAIEGHRGRVQQLAHLPSLYNVKQLVIYDFAG